MSVVETLLVFVAIPAVLFALLALPVLGSGAARGARYRPGRGWSYEPVWYAPHPAALSHSPSGASALTAGTGETRTAKGGASGTW
ncbi:hypothetical protein BH20ACT5_BH20ACT5_04250 [soil metagenome]